MIGWNGTVRRDSSERVVNGKTVDRLMMERNVAREFRRKSQPHLFGETYARQ